MDKRQACIKALELFFAELEEVPEGQKTQECPKFALDFVVIAQEMDRKEFHYCDPCYTVFAKWRMFNSHFIYDPEVMVQIDCPCHLMRDQGHGEDCFQKARELAEKYMRDEFFG